MSENLKSPQPERPELTDKEVDSQFDAIADYYDSHFKKVTSEALQQEQPALFDIEGNVNPDLVESPVQKTEKPQNPLELYSVDELRTALALAENNSSNIEDQKEDEAYAENERRDTETSGEMSPDETDYNTRIATSVDRVSRWLGGKAEKYENAGGAKGLAKKALRRFGSATYRKSGLKAGVEKVQRGIEAVDRALDRTIDRVDQFSNDVEDKVLDAKDKYRKAREALASRCNAAHERTKKRAKQHERQRAQKTARKLERTQERSEKEKALYEYNWRGGPRPDFLDGKKAEPKNKKMGRIGVRSPFYIKNTPES